MTMLLFLKGTHYEMGLQHAQQVQPLHPLILEAMEKRLKKAGLLQDPGAQAEALMGELRRFLEDNDRPGVEMLMGLAEGLGVEQGKLFRYVFASLVEDRGSPPGDRCSTWAASGRATRNGEVILAKNRDYDPAHLPLQVLIRVEPKAGYRYLCVSSAGCPGVYSSGINEAGLAVADTRVRSPDMGIGLPRHSVMMQLLERFASVEEALAWLKSIPHAGGGNLVLADARGGIAVFEAGHSAQGVVEPQRDFIVNTNHYVTEGLQDKWVDKNPPRLRGNSLARRQLLQEELQKAWGAIDVAFARHLMATHRGPLASLCRHTDLEAESATISCTIFLPQERKMLFCGGYPCSQKYHVVMID